jgi:hypothetical protein
MLSKSPAHNSLQPPAARSGVLRDEGQESDDSVIFGVGRKQQDFVRCSEGCRGEMIGCRLKGSYLRDNYVTFVSIRSSAQW